MLTQQYLNVSTMIDEFPQFPIINIGNVLKLLKRLNSNKHGGDNGKWSHMESIKAMWKHDEQGKQTPINTAA